MNSQNKLANILTFVPGFLEDETRSNLDDDLEKQQNLIQRIIEQLEQLFQWRWRWQERHSAAAWEAARGDSDVSPMIQFMDPQRAVEIMLYNACLMWLLGVLWKISPDGAPEIIFQAATTTSAGCSSGHRGCSPLLLPGQDYSLRGPAIEVCRVLNFQLEQASKTTFSALCFLMPVGMAWSVLENDDEWRAFISGSLAKSSITKGYETGANVFGFGLYTKSQPLA